MANALFASFKQQLGLAAIGALNAAGTVIKATLVDTGAYTFNAAHTVIGDVPAGARIATGTLANKTWTGAVFDADDLTYAAVPAGAGSASAAEALVLWVDTGTPATSFLIAYFDTVTGLPVTPNGGDIQIVWDSGANKIFKL